MSYYVDVQHRELKKFRRITGSDEYVVSQKARAQLEAWDEQWKVKKAALDRVESRETGTRLAQHRTKEVKDMLERIDSTLRHTLTVNDCVDWDTLRDKTRFNALPPRVPDPEKAPREPLDGDPEFRPKKGLLDFFSKSTAERHLAEARARFSSAHAAWEKAVSERDLRTQERDADYRRALQKWEREKDDFEQAREAHNAAIEGRRRLYLEKDPGAIADYCDLVLSRSEYPDFFPQDYELDYSAANGILVVDYRLPAPDAIPRVKEVRYVQSRSELVDVAVSEAEANKRYDSLIYQIALRTLHELYEADAAGALKAIVFNGWVRSIDKSTGHEVDACIVSVQADMAAIQGLDLAHVDPKACFRALKGIGSSKLHSLAPVAPILKIDRTDHRFVQAREVISELDAGLNLATMDWEDFEHLVRELFEAEFASAGGEVKVTQASRDGGVDAVAFDPDPIRGGKIVIQAKRYANTVGVAAVRDLYGTVVNEGATKGILVTTSDYGPDAYDFAQGKPITLLSGSNLLHLMEKHGHRARIDLAEARAILSEKSR